MDTKVCSKCGVEKALCEFFKDKSKKGGYRRDCKVCNTADRDRRRRANMEKERARRREWDRANKDMKKAYHEANKVKILKRDLRYRQENKDYFLEYNRAYRSKNKQKVKDYHKRYREGNKEHLREVKNSYARKSRKSDPAYRLRGIVSNAFWAALKNQGNTKGGATFSTLPYSPHDLVEHLERQFDDKMNWDNYGSYWDVDHIHPQSLLPYDCLDHPNFQKC